VRLDRQEAGKNAVMRVPSHAVLRTVALFALGVLVTAACRSANNNNPAPETEPPTTSPDVQSSGTFQLAGSVDHAFQGVGPPVTVSLAGVNLSPSPTTAASASPGATATPTTGSPTQQGVMRLTLDDVPAALHDKCGLSSGDKVNVFWLTDTLFDTAMLTGTTIEGSLEGRRLGVAGSIFLTRGQQEQQDIATATPAASATSSPGFVNTNCTLVADRIAASTEGAPLPTVRPRRTPNRSGSSPVTTTGTRR
jgi:hypothetical protein